MRLLAGLLFAAGCADARVSAVDELAGAWFTDEGSIGYDTIYDTAISHCTDRVRLEMDGEAMLLVNTSEDCTAYDLVRELHDCTAQVPVEGLLVGTGCTETDEVHDGEDVDVEAHSGRELRFYPVILQGDQLQLGDQLLQRER